MTLRENGFLIAGLKALLSVFKSRGLDPSREKDTAVEKCEVTIEDGHDKAQCRMVIRMICRHGEPIIPQLARI